MRFWVRVPLKCQPWIVVPRKPDWKSMLCTLSEPSSSDGAATLAHWGEIKITPSLTIMSFDASHGAIVELASILEGSANGHVELVNNNSHPAFWPPIGNKAAPMQKQQQQQSTTCVAVRYLDFLDRRTDGRSRAD
jgi:hypothetical protein